jgi:predicted PurR-regulated permease PerM
MASRTQIALGIHNLACRCLSDTAAWESSDIHLQRCATGRARPGTAAWSATHRGAETMITSRLQLLCDIRRGLYILMALISVAVLEWAKAFFIPLAMAALLAFCLNPLVSRLRRFGIPVMLGAALVLGIAVLLVLAGVLSLQDDVHHMLAELPASARHLRRMMTEVATDTGGWWQRLNLIARNAGATAATSASAGTPLAVPAIRDGLGPALVKSSLGAAVFLGQSAIVVFLVYFLLVMRLPLSGASRLVTREVLREIGIQAQRFIGVLVVTNLALGLSTWGCFFALGVSHSEVWGAAAAVLHFIPYAGPAAVALASALAAAVQFESVGRGLLVAAVFLSLSTVFGVLLTSWLTGRAARMNSAIVFVGLLFWGWLWGLPGLLLGAPMTMALKVVADRVPELAWLARLMRAGPDQLRMTSGSPDQAHQHRHGGSEHQLLEE